MVEKKSCENCDRGVNWEDYGEGMVCCICENFDEWIPLDHVRVYQNKRKIISEISHQSELPMKERT